MQYQNIKSQRITYFLIVCALIIIFFHSCIKDVGKPILPPFNYYQTEGFENSVNLPLGWTLYNPNNDAAWEIVSGVGHTSTNCVGFNNCSGNGSKNMTGKRDRLISPSYDFSKATVALLSFDVAYAALLDSNNQSYSDSLAVFCSVDGGSWVQLYLKGGEDLSNISTISTSPPCWSPTSSSDWKTEYIRLTNFAGQSNVRFAFENLSASGEWIYLDNITITAHSGDTDCDKITYSKDIKIIIDENCSIPHCHVHMGSGPTDFTNFDGVKTDADNGRLKRMMIDGNPSFMPPTGKLPDSVLNKVVCWLNAGAPNN